MLSVRKCQNNLAKIQFKISCVFGLYLVNRFKGKYMNTNVLSNFMYFFQISSGYTRSAPFDIFVIEHGFWVSFNFSSPTHVCHLPSFKRCRILAACLDRRPKRSFKETPGCTTDHITKLGSVWTHCCENLMVDSDTLSCTQQKENCAFLWGFLCSELAGTFSSLHIHTFIHKGKENPGVRHPKQLVSAAGEIKTKTKNKKEANLVQLECIPFGQQRKTNSKKSMCAFSLCARLVLWTSNKVAQGDWSEQEGTFRITARRQEQPCALQSDVLLRSQTLRGWKWTLIKWWLHEFSAITLCHTLA